MQHPFKVGITALLWLLLMIIGITLGGEREWLGAIPAILLHEGGHCLAARLCRVRIRGLSFGLMGARLRAEGILSYGQEFIIAAAGPFVNFVCVFFLWPTQDSLLQVNPCLAYFFYASLGLGLLNLMPVGTLDGGRMLRASLSRVFTPEIAASFLRLTTTIFLVSLWLLAVYALLHGAPLMSGTVFIFSLLLQYLGCHQDSQKQ